MITMESNQMMIERYRHIRSAASEKVEIEMKDYILIIEGQGLIMQAMTKDEILLKGMIHCVWVNEYEESSRR